MKAVSEYAAKSCSVFPSNPFAIIRLLFFDRIHIRMRVFLVAKCWRVMNGFGKLSVMVSFPVPLYSWLCLHCPK